MSPGRRTVVVDVNPVDRHHDLDLPTQRHTSVAGTRGSYAASSDAAHSGLASISECMADPPRRGGGLGGWKWADHPPFGLDRVRPDAAGRHELVGDGVVRCRTIIAATEELPVPTGSGCVGRGRAAANLPDRALVRLRRAHLWHHPTAVSRCCISTMATRKTPRGGGGEVGTGWASCRRSHSVRAPVVLPVSTCWPPVAGRTASAVSADARCTTGKGAL